MTTMSVSEAVRARMSVRAFLPKPVAEKTVREILEIARRAPSGGNLQPWRVDVIAGATLESLKAAIEKNVAEGVEEKPEYDIYPPQLWEPHRSYRYKVGEDMYALVGLARENKLGRAFQMLQNFKFFGAPVGLFFSFDRRMGPPQWSDLGMYMQTIMLLAVERGLDTCAQESWSRWPQTLRAFLGHGEDQIMFSGMALGFKDPDHPINRLRTERAEVDAVATFRGFEQG